MAICFLPRRFKHYKDYMASALQTVGVILVPMTMDSKCENFCLDMTGLPFTLLRYLNLPLLQTLPLGLVTI